MVNPDSMPQSRSNPFEFEGTSAVSSVRPPCLVLTWDGAAATAQGVRSCVLGGAINAGEGLPRLREGIFAEWCWDGSQLEARNDRFGFQPLFYAVEGTTLWLSPSIPELVLQGAPTDIDDAGLAVFLRLNHFVGNDTPFLHIRALPPAAILIWREGRCRVEGARAERPLLSIKRDAAISRYAGLFRAAIAKDTIDPARTIVPLSAGRDSRHILLALHAAGKPPSACVTVWPAPPQSIEDLTVARVVATAVGVPHVAIPTTTDRLGDEVEKNWSTSLTVFEHFWEMGVVRYATGRNLVIYDGIAGDVLSESKYMNSERLALFRRRDVKGYADAEMQRESYLPALLQPALYRRLSRGLALERLQAELQTHIDAPNPVGSYRFWNRTRRAVAQAPFGMLARVATVRAPYLDHDLYDFLASLPAEQLVDRTFHSETIARSFPAFAAIPFENFNAPRPPARGHMARFALRALVAESRGAVARMTRGERGVVMRHGAYSSRLAARLFLLRPMDDADLLATLGTYLGQLEALSGQSLPVRYRAQAAR